MPLTKAGSGARDSLDQKLRLNALVIFSCIEIIFCFHLLVDLFYRYHDYGKLPVYRDHEEF
ncbi:hypothetical protein CMK14_05965 [Candidatus Poribacteria bacterium]|nr:hypothetical protein [Candidatus Poribacteria bacterium]